MKRPKSPKVIDNVDKTRSLFAGIHQKQVNPETVKSRSLFRLVANHGMSHKKARKLLGLPIEKL
jgi:hypothetical protein